MKEEITDVDDYADWIQWAADAEKGKKTLSKAMSAAVSQPHFGQVWG